MTNDDYVEILAMNIWIGVFGEKVIRPEWTAWAKRNPNASTALRDQAAEMIGVARSHPGQDRPTTRAHHHHSLGWLFH